MERCSHLALSLLGLLLILPTISCQTGPASRSEWTALFNGKDLSGWTIKCQPQDQGKVFWTVADGAILCDSMGRKDHNYVWLLTEKEFADFELRLQFQAYQDSPGNSGLQFRSRFDETANGGWLDGPKWTSIRRSRCPGAPASSTTRRAESSADFTQSEERDHGSRSSRRRTSSSMPTMAMAGMISSSFAGERM
jgi:hypothetical protein